MGEGEELEISDLVLVVESELLDMGHTPTFSNSTRSFPTEENYYFGIQAQEISDEDGLVVPFDTYVTLGSDLKSHEGDVRISGMRKVDSSSIGVAREYKGPHEYRGAKVFEGPAARAELERRFGEEQCQQALKSLGIE